MNSLIMFISNVNYNFFEKNSKIEQTEGVHIWTQPLFNETENTYIFFLGITIRFIKVAKLLNKDFQGFGSDKNEKMDI